MITFAVLALILAFVLVFLNIRRGRSKVDFELSKNCLLTRYPIVFLNGHCSLLYFTKYWNHIPLFLREHGYDIFELNLPWRKQKQRIATLEKFLKTSEKHHLKFHVIGDATCEKDLNWLADKDHDHLMSCTMVLPEEVKKEKVTVADLSPSEYKIEILQLKNSKGHFTVKSLIWWLLIKIHNFILFPNGGVKPHIVAHPHLCNEIDLAKNYLNYAVKLAEADY